MTRISHIPDAAERLVQFIRKFAGDNHYAKVVVGLSGGVDSSLSAALGALALSPANVLGVIMPYRSSSAASELDALTVADKLGIATEKVDITPMIDSYFGSREISSLRRGNKAARERMAVLFDIASRDSRLVLGTSNKTEICLGYATWYGDAACSLNPLGGLYKREVWDMARLLELPEQVIAKTPTADLWPGQTDEGELGISYQLADKVLYAIVEEGERSAAKLRALGVDDKTLQMVIDRINRFAFKRSLPAVDLLDGQPIPKSILLS